MAKPTPPVSAIREYNRFLQKYAETYIKIMREELEHALPELRDVSAREQIHLDDDRMDENIEKRLKRLFQFVTDKMTQLYPDTLLGRWVKQMIGSVNNTSKKNTQRAVTKAYKKKNRRAEVPDFEPLFTDKKLHPFFQNMIDENVGLIRSVHEDKMEALKTKLTFLITKDASHKDIAKELQENFGFAKNKASLIARDQVGKLNGQLAQYRQQQLGGSRYIWHNVHDSRVAGNPSGKYPKAEPSHWAREGKIYSWSKPPKGGHPGQRPRCRCWAEMITDDILGD